jgi:hypothetical protein
LDELAGGVDFEGAGAGVEAAAGFGAGAGAGVDIAGFEGVLDAGFEAEVLGGTPYHVFRPLCPEQAPVLIEPLK